MHDAQLTASVLLVWTVGVSALDNILRPILIRRAVALPMVLILSGVLGGLIAIGAVGLFIGPVILAVTYHLLLAWINQPEKLVAQGNPDGQGHLIPRRTD
jgi:predicted PurR-regulated permease PerM